MQATRGDAVIPSLFVDPPGARTPAAGPGLLAELDGRKEVRRRSGKGLADGLRRHPRLVAAAAIATLAVLLALLVPVGPDAGESMSARQDATGIQASAPAGTRPVSPAVILDDPPPSRIVAGGREAPAAESEASPMDLLREEVAPVAAPVVRRRPVARADSDVDLLAALVHHAGRTQGPESALPGQAGPLAGVLAMPDPTATDADENPVVSVTRALAMCPPANTEAGVDCRQSACAGRWGEHPSCPRPAASPVRRD